MLSNKIFINLLLLDQNSSIQHAKLKSILKQNDQQSVASILAKLDTSLEDNNLIFTATASAQKDFIETHMASINHYIQERLSDAPTLCVVYIQQGKQELLPFRKVAPSGL